MSHFRTFTVVVEIPDDSDLRYPGFAQERATTALESAGFTNVRLRNAPNPTGEMPPIETTHLGGLESGLTGCCGRTPFELGFKDRFTMDGTEVTCPFWPRGGAR